MPDSCNQGKKQNNSDNKNKNNSPRLENPKISLSNIPVQQKMIPTAQVLSYLPSKERKHKYCKKQKNKSYTKQYDALGKLP